MKMAAAKTHNSSSQFRLHAHSETRKPIFNKEKKARTKLIKADH